VSRVVILYANKYGHTEGVARVVAERLHEHHHEVTLVPVRRRIVTPSLEGFDAVVVGAAVHMARYPRRLVRLVQRSLPLLTQRPSFFFSVGMRLAATDPKERADAWDVVERFQAATGWLPSRTTVFAGALRDTRCNPLVRFVMKRIALQMGASTDTTRDHGHTDWTAVKGWADEIAADLGAPRTDAVAAPRAEHRGPRGAARAGSAGPRVTAL
jgi:menaquinone-dependent protoporphyrinogen oxidase